MVPRIVVVWTATDQAREEYVESELARRKRHAAEALAQRQSEEHANMASTSQHPQASTLPAKQVESQRALQGKLMEIDLGEEARARNVEMTERARRRLQGLGAEDEDDASLSRRKVRLGPDGKPWRPRDRRGSDAIKRDQLVEEFLSENRRKCADSRSRPDALLKNDFTVGVYDLQPEQSTAVASLEDEEMAADDRIAEEFRREFMDAISQRRRRRAVQPAKPSTRKEEEILRGPKLGGSRNARAAMRDLLLKEQEKKKRR